MATVPLVTTGTNSVTLKCASLEVALSGAAQLSFALLPAKLSEYNTKGYFV